VNWRAVLLSGVLAAGLTLTFVPRVAADPPPWAGAWRHAEHGDADHMNYNRAKIAENEQTGRHPKALQWYRDDLRNAERNMSNYRYQGSRFNHDPY
jgi:hypothetical protein